MISQKKVKKEGKSEKGFFKLIILIVVALITLNFLGFNIESLWSDFIFPTIDTIWKVLVWFANVLYGLIKIGFNSVQLIVDAGNKIIGR